MPGPTATAKANLVLLLSCCLYTLSGTGCAAKREHTATPVASRSSTSPLPGDGKLKESTVMWLKQAWPYDVFWSDTSDRAAAAVYVAGRGGLEGKGVMPWLVVAVWSDGRIISSADRLTGGQPYSRSQIAPETVANLIRELTAVATKSGVASISYVGPPDYATTVIQFRTVDGRIYGLSSWHELEEESGDWVVTERGSIKLERGQNPQTVIRDNSGEYYMKFRRVWSGIRQRIGDAVPQPKSPAPEGIVRFVPAQRS